MGMVRAHRGEKVLKIIFVLPDMAGGGTERVVSLLANEYVKRGFEVAILSFAGTQQAYDLDKRVETVSAGRASGGSLKVRMRRLSFMAKYFRQNRNCQIFSFSTIGTGFIVLSTLFTGRRMLVSERSDPGAYDHKLYRNFFYGFADRLVCQTEEAIACFPKRLQKKACVIGNPVDAAMPTRFTGIREKRIVTAGRLEAVKNHKMLIEAFGMFRKDFPDYTLEIYGKGSMEEELRQFVGHKGLTDKVVFRGFCSNVKEEIRTSSMFVLSSNYEGISNSMVEAMAMGIPVIATDCPVGGCRTYIEDGVNGLLVPVGDAVKMAEAMRKLAEDSEFSENISINAEKVRKQYSMQKIADQMLEAAGIIVK